jgi:hypothetical protein
MGVFIPNCYARLTEAQTFGFTVLGIRMGRTSPGIGAAYLRVEMTISVHFL